MSEWQFAQRGNKIFAYRNGGCKPEFTFEREGTNTNFKGHGIHAMSIATIAEHVRKYDGVNPLALRRR